jgi:membrane protein DedA with SNARE-associated domain
MSALQHVLSAAAPYLHEYGYPALFAGLFLESFGSPAPGESLLISAAILAGKGDMSLALVMSIAWSAAVLGDNVGYAIGRFGGRRLVLRFGPHLALNRERLESVEAFFKRFGGWLVVVARFIIPARQLNGIVAGTALMPWWRFVLCNAIGAALWVGVWSLGGQYVGDHAAALIQWTRRHGYLAAAFSITALALFALFFTPLRKRLRPKSHH